MIFGRSSAAIRAAHNLEYRPRQRHARRVRWCEPHGRRRAVWSSPQDRCRFLDLGREDMGEAFAWVKRCPSPMRGPSEIEIRPFLQDGRFGDITSNGTRAAPEQAFCSKASINPAEKSRTGHLFGTNLVRVTSSSCSMTRATDTPPTHVGVTRKPSDARQSDPGAGARQARHDHR